VAAGIGVFAVDMWPVLLIWWAGSSGSVGDLSQVRFLGISTLYAAGLAALSGRLMAVALERAEASPRLARLDPWGAYALGIGVYELALTAVPAIMYGLLLADENQSLRSREWLVHLLWIGGHLAAALLGFAAARALLGPGYRPPETSPVASGELAPS
jgi:hypothetical protein